jgi:hypothetical protein
MLGVMLLPELVLPELFSLFSIYSSSANGEN